MRHLIIIVVMAITSSALQAADEPAGKLPPKVDQEYHAYLAALVKSFQAETAKFETQLKRDASAAKKDAEVTAAITALQDKIKDGRHLAEFAALIASQPGAGVSGGATGEIKIVTAEDQDKAIAELQKLGGKIKLDGRVAISADLGDIDITDEGLVYLDSLPQLKVLSLRHGYKVTATGLVHLRGLAQLESLDIWDLKAGMKDDQLPLLIKALSQLKNLNVGGCPLTNDALVCLEGNTQLQSLTLTYTNVTDAGLIHLTKMTGLKKLDCNLTKITDEGVKKLQESLPTCKINR